ncbi:DNA starvation/stationary phase protection protein [Candidatus Dependentiae bacterium]|nr:DNA starvation/stationary phase protection protein [Candidatus Dependentiae bacterium]
MAKLDVKISQKVLQEMLANHGVLLFETLNYHWNLVGKEFHDYHILFDGQYKQLFENMDLIAERIRAIQGQALGSMKEFLATAIIKEDTKATREPRQMIIRLLAQYEKMIEHIRDSIGTLEAKTQDYGTRKMLEDLIEQHEKTAWMLRSLTEK